MKFDLASHVSISLLTDDDETDDPSRDNFIAYLCSKSDFSKNKNILK